MNATQQHMLDLFRAAQLGEPAPPAPGRGDWQAVREFRTWREFQAVVDANTATRRARWAALLRLLRPAARTTGAAPVRTPALSPSAVRRDAVQESADSRSDVVGRPAQCG
ncbi:hypothetical protein AB8O64_20310 [Streptomyces sp. QH1-20]|uniref:hypothetical protein n=1 Tax=Streptomyces sp. QH1-20 TaxID=3240934 RepID=UPI00351721EB